MKANCAFIQRLYHIVGICEKPLVTISEKAENRKNEWIDMAIVECLLRGIHNLETSTRLAPRISKLR